MLICASVIVLKWFIWVCCGYKSSLIHVTWICLRCFEKVKTDSPNGGLMVIIYGIYGRKSKIALYKQLLGYRIWFGIWNKYMQRATTRNPSFLSSRLDRLHPRNMKWLSQQEANKLMLKNDWDQVGILAKSLHICLCLNLQPQYLQNLCETVDGKNPADLLRLVVLSRCL